MRSRRTLACSVLKDAAREPALEVIAHMTKPLRAALIGYGFIGSKGHLEVYRSRQQLGDVVIEAVADICEARRDEARKACGESPHGCGPHGEAISSLFSWCCSSGRSCAAKAMKSASVKIGRAHV